MAWFEAHQTMAKHPKTLKLSRLLKVDRRYAVGLLCDLFSWALDCAKSDGELPGMAGEDIAAALDFAGKKGDAVVAALLDSGYLECDDGVYKIHDWHDYSGKLSAKREADRDKMRRYRSQKNE